jgi:hypothetical protein
MTDGVVEPFAPPADVDDPSSRWFLVVVAWLLAGATAGTAVGVSLHLFGVFPGVMAPIGMVSGIALGVVGGIAYRMERAWSSNRPLIIDGRGRLGRPLHVGLFALPSLVALPSLLWLVVVGSVSAQSAVPGIAFGMAAVALVWGLRKLVSKHVLTRALEELESGQSTAAVRRLGGLWGGWWATRAARDVASLNLGLLAVRDHDLDGAVRWYERVPGRSAAFPHAAVGLAFVRVAMNQLPQAEELLHLALSRGGRVIHDEVDEVRLLLVMRRDGASAARELGERILGPSSGAMFRGLLAVARRRDGDPGAASELHDASVDDMAERMRGIVPELADVI